MATGKRNPERFQRKVDEFSESRLEMELNKVLRENQLVEVINAGKLKTLPDVADFMRRVLKKRARGKILAKDAASLLWGSRILALTLRDTQVDALAQRLEKLERLIDEDPELTEMESEQQTSDCPSLENAQNNAANAGIAENDAGLTTNRWQDGTA
jgi:hypothetical protein